MPSLIDVLCGTNHKHKHKNLINFISCCALCLLFIALPRTWMLQQIGHSLRLPLAFFCVQLKKLEI